MMCPHDIKLEGNSNVFFDTITRMLNMRCFNAQQVVLDHRMEERDNDMVLHDDDKLAMKADVRDVSNYRHLCGQ